MKPYTVKWFILLALNTKVFCSSKNPFSLKDKLLTTVEESCVEIKCEVSQYVNVPETAYWFWMKDATYADDNKSFTGTIVYSSNEAKRSVSPEFKNRVTYTGSPPASWWYDHYCSILICDLKKNDSGNYQFRFIQDGTNKWITQHPTNLRVTENLCPITFNKSATVMENDSVTLICSTIRSCHSFLQISDSMQQLASSSNNKPATSKIPHNFKANWTDDGKVFSCKTDVNTDSYLIRNFTLTVKYGPKEVMATQSSEQVIENNSVTLRCSAKGSPAVTFKWFKDNNYKTSVAEMNFTSIKASDSGSYRCEAQNEHGKVMSNTLNINVLYVPEVHVTINNQLPRRSSNQIEEGDRITLKCNLIRSNSQPVDFTWIKDEKRVGKESIYVLGQIKPEHSGTYTCKATNSVGSGTNNTLLQVRYKPRSSVHLRGATNNKVKVNSKLQLTCKTDAYPEPDYSWYSYTEMNKLHWKWLGLTKTLTLNLIKKEDEACYICNATNSVGKGNMSKPECIQVLYPPTNVQLTLPPKVRETQPVTITCSAESSPPSDFKIKRSSSPNNQSSEHLFYLPANKQDRLIHTFTATEAHAGFYTCEASNSEGTNRSSESKLEVEYPPKDVKIEAQKSLEVEENQTFSLSCRGRSNPPVSSYRWIKATGNKDVGQIRVYSVKSASLSDDGRYSCEAKNQIGTGRSQQVEVKIMYAPKLTTISKGNERQLSGGRKSVILSCISRSYPAATFVWYNKTGGKEVFRHQNLTVHSHEAGEFYCTAENRFGKTQSDSVKLFDDSGKMLKIFIFSCFIILVLLLFFLYRRNKSNQQRTTNTWPFCGFLAGWTGSWRRIVRNETMLAEPFRSRDDLLPGQPCRLNVQHSQPRPDVTSASNIDSVYATVFLPHKNQSHSAQNPAGPQREPEEKDSVNYASLHFKKKKKPEDDAVYSQVCKPKVCKENEQQSKLYENFNMKNSANPSFSYEDDSDSSEQEVELSYTEVNFQPKPGHQRATRTSSSSEDTQYSQVKL